MSNFQRFQKATLPNVADLSHHQKEVYDTLLAQKASLSKLNFWATINGLQGGPTKIGTTPGELLDFWREKSLFGNGIQDVGDATFTKDEFNALCLVRIVRGSDTRLAIDFIRELQECLRTWICAHVNEEVGESGGIPEYWSQALVEVRQIEDFLDMAVVGLARGTDFYFLTEHWLLDMDSDRLMLMRDAIRNGFLKAVTDMPFQLDAKTIRMDNCSIKDHVWNYNALHQFISALFYKVQDQEMIALAFQTSVENEAAARV